MYAGLVQFLAKCNSKYVYSIMRECSDIRFKMLELIELHFVDKLYTSSPLFGITSIGAVYKNRGNKNRLERDIKFLYWG